MSGNFTMRLDERTAEELNRLARETARTRANLLRFLIRQAARKIEADESTPANEARDGKPNDNFGR